MPPITLTAAVHPILRDRHKALTAALFAIWEELGVEVRVATTDMKSYLDAQAAASSGPPHRAAGWRTTRTRTTSRSTSSTRASATSGPSFRRTRPTASPRRRGSRAAPRSAKVSTGNSRASSSTRGVVIPLFHEVDYRIAGPGRARPRAAQQPAVRQLPRDREVGGAGRPRRARLGRRRHPRADRRRRARTSTRPPWGPSSRPRRSRSSSRRSRGTSRAAASSRGSPRR